MTSLHSAAHRDAMAAPAPLAPEQRAEYAVAIEQSEAVFALEDMAPSAQDKAIDVAILAGKLSPEQAREELLSYLTGHKTVCGFIDSRAWSAR
jgi:hypothetical protein